MIKKIAFLLCGMLLHEMIYAAKHGRTTVRPKVSYVAGGKKEQKFSIVSKNVAEKVTMRRDLYADQLRQGIPSAEWTVSALAACGADWVFEAVEGNPSISARFCCATGSLLLCRAVLMLSKHYVPKAIVAYQLRRST